VCISYSVKELNRNRTVDCIASGTIGQLGAEINLVRRKTNDHCRHCNLMRNNASSCGASLKAFSASLPSNTVSSESVLVSYRLISLCFVAIFNELITGSRKYAGILCVISSLYKSKSKCHITLEEVNE